MILDGEMDKYPEAAFNLKGNIDDVIAAGEKMLTEA
jgi:F-type H+-transporting ATPase subunit beta